MKIKLFNSVIIVLLSALLALLLLVSSITGQGEFNPWADLNNDGEVDILDAIRLAAVFGTSGEPLTFPASLEYNSGWLDISDKQGQYFNVTHNLGSDVVFMPRVHGRTSLNGRVHQRYFDGTGSPPGFNRTYGKASVPETAFSVVQTSDWGYAMAGGSGVSPNRNFWLVKTDRGGNMEWNKTYGGSRTEEAKSLIQTVDGGYAMVGYVEGALDDDFWLVKTYPNGTMQWNQTYDGAFDDRAYSLVQTNDEGFAIAGDSGTSIWLVKTGGNGIMEWNQKFRSEGDTGDYARCLVKTGDGGLAIAGANTSVGEWDVWLIKTDENGGMEWNQTYHNSPGDWAECLVQTSDLGYAIAGSTYSTITSSEDSWLIKVDENGIEQWNRTYGGPNDNKAEGVVETSDGGYALAGGDGLGDAWLVKTDSEGNMVWNRTYGGTPSIIEQPYSMVLTGDGGYAMAGIYWSMSPSERQFLLIRTDFFGFAEFRKCIGLAMTGYTSDALTFYRGETDPYWNFVRVTIWVIKETP